MLLACFIMFPPFEYCSTDPLYVHIVEHSCGMMCSLWLVTVLSGQGGVNAVSYAAVSPVCNKEGHGRAEGEGSVHACRLGVEFRMLCV